MTAPLLPNRLHYDHADSTLSLPIGEVHSIQTGSFGLFDVRFMYGTRLELTHAALVALVRRGQETLAAIPRDVARGNCSGARADLGGDV